MKSKYASWMVIAIGAAIIGGFALGVWICWRAAVPVVASAEARIYYLQGFGKQNRGDLKGALAAYDRAIAIDPKFPEGYGLLRSW